MGRKSCTGQCVGQWFLSTVVHRQKELYWAVCWSVIPVHCGAWAERVVLLLGNVLVSQDGSSPLWCVGRKSCTGQCVGQ